MFSAIASLRISVRVTLVSSVTSRSPSSVSSTRTIRASWGSGRLAHEAARLCAIHQPHCAVTLQQEVIRQFAH